MQHAISILVTNVFPLFALPVIATSSRLGKHGLPNSWNRKSIGGSSFSGVILSFSNISIFGLSVVASPAWLSSTSNCFIDCSSIVVTICSFFPLAKLRNICETPCILTAGLRRGLKVKTWVKTWVKNLPNIYVDSRKMCTFAIDFK